MNRSRDVRPIFLAMILCLRAICCAAQEQPTTPAAKAAEDRKTRTELLNELNLRTAQVDLENARQAYDRYHRELVNEQGLFQRSVISKKELDDAISADAQALQKLRQAEIAGNRHVKGTHLGAELGPT